MPIERYDTGIVGAGHAGAQLAIALRQSGYRGSIALVGDEPGLPYGRPPLSKDYLAGDKGFERILIRQPGFREERTVTLRRGERVVTVDPVARRVACDSGAMLNSGRLVWAAGGTARRLGCGGHDLVGLHT